MDVSKIEKAKRIRALGAISPEMQETLMAQLVSPGERPSVEGAVAGLGYEDEFAIVCKLMGTCRSIVRLEQAPVIRNDYIVPDFLAEFRASLWFDPETHEELRDLRCLVEVKSTARDTWKLGGSVLRRRRQFADSLGLPLLFAIRFTGIGSNTLWAIVLDRRERTSLHASLNDISGDGIGTLLWHDAFYLLAPGLNIAVGFDREADPADFFNSKLGALQYVRLKTTQHDEVFEDSRRMIFSLLHTLALEKMEKVEEGSRTVIVYRPSVIGGLISNTAYRMNLQATGPDGSPAFDPARILAHADNDKYRWLVDAGKVHHILRKLMPNFVVGHLTLGSEDALREVWNAIFRPVS